MHSAALHSWTSEVVGTQVVTACNLHSPGLGNGAQEPGAGHQQAAFVQDTRSSSA